MFPMWNWWGITRNYQAQLDALKLQVKKIMVDLSKLQTDADALTSTVAAVKTNLEGLSADIATLKAQVAALQDPALQATVDAIDQKVADARQALEGADKANPA